MHEITTVRHNAFAIAMLIEANPPGARRLIKLDDLDRPFHRINMQFRRLDKVNMQVRGFTLA